jgi:hypothetical protein
VAQVIYQDEDGRELWRSDRAEYTPTGTLVTRADGERYLVVRAAREQEAAEAPTFVLRLLEAP